MARNIFVGLLLSVTACSGQSLNELGAIHATGGTGTLSGVDTNLVGGSAATGGQGNSGAQTGFGGGNGGSVTTDAGSGNRTTATGGEVATGGITGTGGSATGGAVATGGIAGSGGSATGGAVATGGISGIGGSATGGSNATGGLTHFGGSATGGLNGSGGTQGQPVLDLSCQSDIDCCVVADSCQSTLYLVKDAQKTELSNYLASMPTTRCPLCMPPSIAVSCQAGTCVGEEVSPTNAAPGLSAPHCGPIVGLGASGGASSTPSTTAAGPVASEPQVVFGCQ